MSTVKEEAIQLIESLPANCTMEEIQYHLHVRDKIRRGLAAADEGRVVSHDEVKRQVQQWLGSFGQSRP